MTFRARTGAILTGSIVASAALIAGVATPASAAVTSSIILSEQVNERIIGEFSVNIEPPVAPADRPAQLRFDFTPVPGEGEGHLSIPLEDRRENLENCDGPEGFPYFTCDWPNPQENTSGTGFFVLDTSQAAGRFIIEVSYWPQGEQERRVILQQELFVSNAGEPDSLVDVWLQTSADTTLRSEPAEILLTCDDGSATQMAVQPGQSDQVSDVLTVKSNQTCMVTRGTTGAGAAPRVDVATYAVVSDLDNSVAYALGTPFPSGGSDRTTVEIVDTFTRSGESGVPADPSVPIDPALAAAGAAPAPVGHALAESGVPDQWPGALLAGLAVIAGTTLVVSERAIRRQRRSAR